MVLFREGMFIICHVGDSRAYHFQQGILRQITNDDNYAAMLAASGKVPPEQIPASYRHILTQVVGISDELVPEFHIFETRPWRQATS